MKHIKIDNVDYVIARIWSDERVELVDPSGRIKFVRASDLPLETLTQKEQFMIPGMLPFLSRDPEFILKLQNRRIEVLKENIKIRRSRSKAAKSLNPDQSPSRTRRSKISQSLESVPAHLRDQIAQAMAHRRSSK